MSYQLPVRSSRILAQGCSARHDEMNGSKHSSEEKKDEGLKDQVLYRWGWRIAFLFSPRFSGGASKKGSRDYSN